MNFGIIGNCKSAALIDEKGSIVWCCLPDFDSTSVFASLLDTEKGGEFGILVDDSYTITQAYIPNTNVLVTSFNSPAGSFDVIDFMPRNKEDHHYHCPPEVIRYFRYNHGKPTFRIHYNPKLGYARYETINERHDGYLKSCVHEGVYESVYLYASISLDDILEENEITLTEDAYCLLSYHQKILKITTDRMLLELERTKVYWLDWVERTVRFTDWMDEIRRSALVLKLLSCQSSGAILAAVTTSIPETIGEERNWDYRFCWIRDATMILNILTELGHYNVAQNFFNYVLRVVPYKDDKMQIMYGIHGQKILTEKKLDWLAGYKNSKPVRVGNAAYTQRQHDIYGVLLDAILKYIQVFNSHVETVERLWTITRSLVRTVENTWESPDMSIWEYRSRADHFTFSKVLCWVALDRGVKIAKLLGKKTQGAPWEQIRDQVREDIYSNSWNEKVGAFTQVYHGESLDASNLLMASYGFIDPSDPKFISTVRRTYEQLGENGLMYRYRDNDDFGKPSSSFTICSFWMVKALWQIGEFESAQTMFKELLGYGNHLGLFSEDLDFKTKEMMGNFPQGYSHLALIDCAITLTGRQREKDYKLQDFIEYSEVRKG